MNEFSLTTTRTQTSTTSFTTSPTSNRKRSPSPPAERMGRVNEIVIRAFPPESTPENVRSSRSSTMTTTTTTTTSPTTKVTEYALSPAAPLAGVPQTDDLGVNPSDSQTNLSTSTRQVQSTQKNQKGTSRQTVFQFNLPPLQANPNHYDTPPQSPSPRFLLTTEQSSSNYHHVSIQSPQAHDLQNSPLKTPKTIPQSVLPPTPEEIWWSNLDRCTRQSQTPTYLLNSPLTHRFGDIDCIQSTAVTINNTQFLHANHVAYPSSSDSKAPLSCIASQYPHEHTLLRELFWRSALQYGSIFDLTQKSELEANKLTCYYPNEGEKFIPKIYGSLTITLKKAKLLDENLQKCIYFVQDDSQSPPIIKEIRRIHDFGWQDHTALTSPERLSHLIFLLKQKPEEEACIHCRGGIGRTGTLITAFYLDHMIAKGEVTSENLHQKLASLIFNLRKKRNAQFVKYFTQFQLLIEFGKLKLAEKLKSAEYEQALATPSSMTTPRVNVSESKEEGDS